MLALVIATFALFCATKELVGDAKRSSEKQLRAYLGINAGTISFIRKDGVLLVEVIVENSGQTPAYHVTHSIHAVKVHAGSPQSFVMPERKPQEWPMAPKAQWGLRFDLDNEGASADAVRETIDSGKMVVFVWGRVDYIDAFDQPRHFEFRYRSGREHYLWSPTHGNQTRNGWELDPEECGNSAT